MTKQINTDKTFPYPLSWAELVIISILLLIICVLSFKLGEETKTKEILCKNYNYLSKVTNNITYILEHDINYSFTDLKMIANCKDLKINKYENNIILEDDR